MNQFKHLNVFGPPLSVLFPPPIQQIEETQITVEWTCEFMCTLLHALPGVRCIFLAVEPVGVAIFTYREDREFEEVMPSAQTSEHDKGTCGGVRWVLDRTPYVRADDRRPFMQRVVHGDRSDVVVREES